MGFHPSHHRWSTHELDDRYLMSVCDVCQLAVRHPRGRVITKRHAGRWIGERRLKCTEGLPTCGSVERQVFEPRHKWERVAEAPPSPGGAPCTLYVCARCHIRVEGLSSFVYGPPTKNYAYRRWRMYDADEWSRDDMPACHSYQDDQFTAEVVRLYETMSEIRVAEQLGVSIGCVRARIRLAGVKAEDRKRRKGYRWTQAEDIILANSVDTKTLAEMVKLTKRTRDAVIGRLNVLGFVEAGCPRGWATLEEAARRTGYCAGTLVLWMRRFKWRHQPCYVTNSSLKIRGYDKPRNRIYLMADIERAVRWYESTEPYSVGSARRKVPEKSMASLLLERGLHRPRGKLQWRVPSDVLDECAERYHDLVYMTEYAAEHGVHYNTVLRRVMKAGYDPREVCHGRKISRRILEKVTQQFPFEVRQ
jgi:hypothetical protein